MAKGAFLHDAGALTVTVSLTHRKRGGRKLVITPNGADAWALPQARIDNTMVKALARAHRWKKQLDTGRFQTVQDLAEAGKINPSLHRARPAPHPDASHVGHRPGRVGWTMPWCSADRWPSVRPAADACLTGGRSVTPARARLRSPSPSRSTSRARGRCCRGSGPHRPSRPAPRHHRGRLPPRR